MRRAAESGLGLSDASNFPDYNLSHIYSSGEYELTAARLPDHSLWAQKLGCKAQTRRPDIVDTTPGYMWDARLGTAKRSRTQGVKPRPGRARVFVYPECSDRQFVADVIRLDKGHTERLELARVSGERRFRACRRSVRSTSDLRSDSWLG